MPPPRKAQGHRRKWGHCPGLGRKPSAHPGRWQATALGLRERLVSELLQSMALGVDSWGLGTGGRLSNTYRTVTTGQGLGPQSHNFLIYKTG